MSKESEERTDDFPVRPTPELERAARNCPLLEGDRGEQWIACCSQRFFPLARRIAGDDALAREALRDSWVKILEKIDEARFGGPTACSWVHAIVAHAATDVRRNRDRRRREVPFREEEDSSGEALRDPNHPGGVPRLSEVQAPGQSPEDLAYNNELLVLLREMVAMLPDTYRQVMELHLYRRLSDQEIAEHLHLSYSNVATRLNRASDWLQRRINARLQPSSPEDSRTTGQVPPESHRA